MTGVTLDSGVVDSEALADEHSEALQALAERTAPEPTATATGPGRQPDRFTYELTVDDRTVALHESELTPGLRALVTELERRSRERAKQQKRKGGDA